MDDTWASDALNTYTTTPHRSRAHLSRATTFDGARARWGDRDARDGRPVALGR